MAIVETAVGTIGLRIEGTVKDDGSAVDVSSATVTKQIIITPPPESANGVLTKTATFTTDGTDGKIYYDTISGDLDVPGDYIVQGNVVITAGTFPSIGQHNILRVKQNI